MTRIPLLMASTACGLALASTGALAADLYLDAPVVPVVEIADTYAIELGVAASWLSLSSDPADTISATEDDSYGVLEFTARFGVPVSSNLYLQLDFDGARGFPKFEGENSAFLGSAIGIGHLAYVGDGFLAGAFGGAGIIADNDYEDDPEIDSGSIWVAGLEGQFNFDAASFYGQVGYFDTAMGEESEAVSDAWFARGVVSYFVEENTKLQAELTVGQGLQDAALTGDDVDDLKFVGWGAEIEHKFAEGMAAFVAYNGIQWNEDGDGGEQQVTSHAVKVGLRWSFDDRSLLEANHAGADLGLPNLGYLAAGVTPVD